MLDIRISAITPFKLKFYFYNNQLLKNNKKKKKKKKNHKQTDHLDVNTQGSLMAELQVETYLRQETVDLTTRLGS